jgi:hypothetical protein
MTEGRSPPDRSKANEHQRMKYAKEASSYDKGSDFDERWLYGTEHRTWACSTATGTTTRGCDRHRPEPPPVSTEVRLVGLDLTWIEDPRFSQRPSPREPNWRKVILAIAAIAIVVALALVIGAVIR